MSSSLMFLALIPGILIIIYVYRKDTVEKEPYGLMLKLVIFGALSCVPAMFMEMFMDQFVPTTPKLFYAMGNAFLSAALCEELCKFAFLFLGAWWSKAFNYRFDGIVYGVAVAVGFALLENVLYVMDGGLSVALMRGVLAVPLHAFCGVFMGVFFGAMMKNHVERNHSGVMTCFILALLVPMMIHGIYDTFAFLGNDIATYCLLAFVVLMYIMAIRVIRKFSKEDWCAGFYRDGVAAGNMDSSFHVNTENDQFNLYHGQGGQGSGTTAGYGPSGSDVVLTCPKCRRAMKLPRAAGHVRVTCPYCGKRFETTT